MKAFGIFMIGAMAVAGGIAAATYITKKKIDKENEENYYDDWDFDFDEDMDVENEPAAPGVSNEKSAPEKAENTADKEVPFGEDVFGTEEVGASIDEEL